MKFYLMRTKYSPNKINQMKIIIMLLFPILFKVHLCPLKEPKFERWKSQSSYTFQAVTKKRVISTFPSSQEIIKYCYSISNFPLYKKPSNFNQTQTKLQLQNFNNALFLSISYPSLLFPLYPPHPPTPLPRKLPRGWWGRVVRFQIGYQIWPVRSSIKL